MRHQDARLHAKELECAWTRMIFAEARKRHQERPSFQKRMTHQSDDGDKSKPVLFKLLQARKIIREAVSDVVAAVKACSNAKSGLEFMQLAVRDRQQRAAKARSNMQRHLSRLYAVGAFTSSLADNRLAEAEWRRIRAEIKE